MSCRSPLSAGIKWKSRFSMATTFHDTFTKDEVRSNVAAGTPLRREGQAREVADLVAYLASSESSFITGASVDINGGLFFS
jgi:3-oxoacyl-[acyl-carrier protein] reductase